MREGDELVEQLPGYKVGKEDRFSCAQLRC